jgi:hypothetical protein
MKIVGSDMLFVFYHVVYIIETYNIFFNFINYLIYSLFFKIL